LRNIDWGNIGLKRGGMPSQIYSKRLQKENIVVVSKANQQKVFNGIADVLHTGAPWPDLPALMNLSDCIGVFKVRAEPA
jgi:hypothetical protein